MKAVVYSKYGSPEVLEFCDIPAPTPKDNEVQVKIAFSTVTLVDTAFRSGTPFIARLFTGLLKPKNGILGTEFSGVVDSVGKGVTRFRPGDRVFGAAPNGFGAHAQCICIGQDAAIVKIPDALTFEDAATICNGALTALPFLREGAGLKSGQKILIIGASGSIGTAAVQLAAAMGAEVTGLCSSSNLEMVSNLGATLVIDYTATNFAKTGQKYDVIFDTVGKSSFRKSRSSLTKAGIYLTTIPDPGVLLSPLWTVFHKGKRAKMMATGLRSDAVKIKDMDILKEMVIKDELHPVIDRSYPLEQIRAAHAYVERGHKRGNLLINIPYNRPLI
ncbi:MAG: NAD(P)-dependent alcohol dehydrogenase [Rhodobacteraceae bacterium]|nr:NAD(P)-dependent alcohol dehydrogenase [Paracoccaceae bacterium]